MPSSGITSWPLTAADIVTQACFEIGALAQGETVGGDEMDDAIVRLNAMIRSWQGEGNLFREETTEIIFDPDMGEQLLSTDIRAINNVYVAGSYNRMLAEWNRTQYLSLPNPGQSGTPTIWYAETGVSGLTLHVWPVPTVSTVLALDYQRKAYTITDPSETLDLPEEWQECVILGLASRIASMFGATRADPATVQRVDQRASQLYERLMDRDRPDSYFFEPDF